MGRHRSRGRYSCSTLPDPYRLLEFDPVGEKIVIENTELKGDVLVIPFDSTASSANSQSNDVIETDLSKVKLSGSYLIVDDGRQKKIVVTNPGTGPREADAQKANADKNAPQRYVPFYFNQGDGSGAAILLPVPAPEPAKNKGGSPGP